MILSVLPFTLYFSSFLPLRNFEEVEISNEVGIVSLELLDGSFNPITSAVPLGTEVILRFNLGSGNGKMTSRVERKLPWGKDSERDGRKNKRGWRE